MAAAGRLRRPSIRLDAAVPTTSSPSSSDDVVVDAGGGKTTTTAETSLLSSSEEDEDEDEDEDAYVDDFRPETRTLPSSAAFYVRSVVQSVRRDRLLKRLRPRRRRRILSRMKEATRRRRFGMDSDQLRAKDEGELMRIEAEMGNTGDGERKGSGEGVEEEMKSSGLRDTLRGLNESRRSLVRLVGYDAQLLIPSFTLLILGALATSIVPHYYSQCVTCLVAAGTTTRSEVVRALTGLGLVSALSALFTGPRGSLFLIAGKG